MVLMVGLRLLIISAHEEQIPLIVIPRLHRFCLHVFYS